MSDPLREALEQANDRLQTIWEHIGIEHDNDDEARELVVQNCWFAMQEVDAALAAPPPEAGLQVCVCGHGDEAHLMGWECRRCDCLQYAALPVSPADPPTEHRLYARNPDIPRGEDDPAWCVCGVPFPCQSADPDMEERLAVHLHALVCVCPPDDRPGCHQLQRAARPDAARLIAQGWRRP